MAIEDRKSYLRVPRLIAAIRIRMKGRIGAMAQLHDSLYRPGNFASVDLGAYLQRHRA